MTIAWVFPGQGSQKVGMADPLIKLPGADERFQIASEVLGRDLLAICRGEAGDAELSDLNDTRNTQPALFVTESLLVDNLIAQGRERSFWRVTASESWWLFMQPESLIWKRV